MSRLEPMPVLPRPLALQTPATLRAPLVLLHICCSRVSSFSAIAPKVPEGAIVPGSDPLNSRETSEALPWCDGPCAGRIPGHVLSVSILCRSFLESGDGRLHHIELGQICQDSDPVYMIAVLIGHLLNNPLIATVALG
jgi:hypothetical protein